MHSGKNIYNITLRPENLASNLTAAVLFIHSTPYKFTQQNDYLDVDSGGHLCINCLLVVFVTECFPEKTRQSSIKEICQGEVNTSRQPS